MYTLFMLKILIYFHGTCPSSHLAVYHTCLEYLPRYHMAISFPLTNKIFLLVAYTNYFSYLFGLET